MTVAKAIVAMMISEGLGVFEPVEWVIVPEALFVVTTIEMELFVVRIIVVEISGVIVAAVTTIAVEIAVGAIVFVVLFVATVVGVTSLIVDEVLLWVRIFEIAGVVEIVAVVVEMMITTLMILAYIVAAGNILEATFVVAAAAETILGAVMVAKMTSDEVMAVMKKGFVMVVSSVGGEALLEVKIIVVAVEINVVVAMIGYEVVIMTSSVATPVDHSKVNVVVAEGTNSEAVSLTVDVALFLVRIVVKAVVVGITVVVEAVITVVAETLNLMVLVVCSRLLATIVVTEILFAAAVYTSCVESPGTSGGEEEISRIAGNSPRSDIHRHRHHQR